MKRNIKYILVAGAMLTFGMATMAQTTGELLRLSQYNYGYGTARTAAMGGAFTSLGADLGSMTINPAGLGMYRSSEFSISPSVTTNTIKTQYDFPGARYNHDYSRTRFSFGNVGVAFNFYNGRRGLTGFTFAVGYTKLVDFNTTVYGAAAGNQSSMLDYFGVRLSDADYTPGEIGANATSHDQRRRIFDNVDLQDWGAVLTYQSRMVDPRSDDPNETGYWPVLSSGTTLNPAFRNISRGSVGEYNFAGGFNFNDRIYLGFSIGLQDIYLSNRRLYSESTTGGPGEILSGWEYEKHYRMFGTGVNFKFGVTARPTDNLRIGVAVHTPTYISVEDRYQEFMSSYFNSPNSSFNESIDTPYAPAEYDLQTPTRFLAGLSYTFPGIGIISVDYERVWYNGMRMKDFGWGVDEIIKDEVKEFYKPANNIRAGVEITPTRDLFIRAGYAFYDNAMKSNNYPDHYESNIKMYRNCSFGLGYRFDKFSLDFAYVYSHFSYKPFDLYYVDTEGAPFPFDSGILSPEQNRHTFTLTAGFRF